MQALPKRQYPSFWLRPALLRPCPASWRTRNCGAISTGCFKLQSPRVQAFWLRPAILGPSPITHASVEGWLNEQSVLVHFSPFRHRLPRPWLRPRPSMEMLRSPLPRPEFMSRNCARDDFSFLCISHELGNRWDHIPVVAGRSILLRSYFWYFSEVTNKWLVWERNEFQIDGIIVSELVWDRHSSPQVLSWFYSRPCVFGKNLYLLF